MEILSVPFTGPVIPATVLVCLVLAWSLLTTVGALHVDGQLPLDLGDSSGFDPDVGNALEMPTDGAQPTMSGFGSLEAPTGHEAASSWLAGTSIAALRWLNLGGVPLVIWGAIFAISWWFISGFLWIAIDQWIFAPKLLSSSLLALKNLILAVFLTKLVTKPLKRSLTPNRITTQSLIGKESVISSSEATSDFGLVKFKTGGAPLLLNVRTDGVTLPRGTPVWITHYDPQRRVYIVSPTSTRWIDPEAEKLQGESTDADL